MRQILLITGKRRQSSTSSIIHRRTTHAVPFQAPRKLSHDSTRNPVLQDLQSLRRWEPIFLSPVAIEQPSSGNPNPLSQPCSSGARRVRKQTLWPRVFEPGMPMRREFSNCVGRQMCPNLQGTGQRLKRRPGRWRKDRADDMESPVSEGWATFTDAGRRHDRYRHGFGR
jgi:hypothetical protein